ncbi:MAG TPA: hypothetical protein VKF81_07125 [Blastocatellia bacterium]|nr:hypothetical protein [Blastocatellia bacterium]
MATRALTPVAQRRSRASVSARQAPGHRRDWRQVLLSQDAEAIRHKLSIFVRAAAGEDPAGYEQLTQELFLHLLAYDRFSFYLDEDYSDSDIRTDLLSILSG